jgi:thymidylate synthase (FAD)
LEPTVIVVHPKYEIQLPLVRGDILRAIEQAGRVCYKSEDGINENSASRFVKMIRKNNHESVLEHCSITVKFTVDRGVSHELVRHRLASYSQESTRYCNYVKKGLRFVVPSLFVNEIEDDTEVHFGGLIYYDHPLKMWIHAMLEAESAYLQLVNYGLPPQVARAVLPCSTKTEVVMTANLREWRHVFKLRCAEAAHPDMRAVMCPLRDDLISILPEVFDRD